MKPTAEILASIIEEVRTLTGLGKVADYIPALAKVPSENWASPYSPTKGSDLGL